MRPERYGAVARTSVAEEVRRRLLELVESGELTVGEKLPAEADLANAFGVSRPAVREALVALRTVGVLRSRVGHGTVVAARKPDLLVLGRHTYQELYEVRSDLEVPAAGYAARRRSPTDVARLAEVVDQLDSTEDVRSWVDLDSALHVAIASATGNRVLVQLVENLRDLMTQYSLLATQFPGRREEASREHRAIYAAIAAAKPADARRAMRRHLRNVELRLRREAGASAT